MTIRAYQMVAAVAVALLLATPMVAGAEECERLCTLGFWRTADVAAVQAELDQGVDIEARSRKGKTLLHYAVDQDKPSIVTLLLDRGADIEVKDNDGRTPLHVAVLKGKELSIVKLLLDRGADRNARDNNGKKPFNLAKKNTAAYWFLHKCGHLCDEGFWEKGASEAEVRAELERGADFNLLDKEDGEGWTPLHYVARYSKEPAVFQLLLDQGASFKARHVSGQRPPPLSWLLSFNGEPSVLALLLDQGLDLDSRDFKGRTLLHIAATFNEEPSITELLLDRGADPEPVDNDGGTPLHGATSNNFEPSVTKLLLEKTQDIDAKDNIGWTPLHGAARYNREPVVVELLLDWGADPRAVNNRGQTPFDLVTDNTDLRGTKVYQRLRDAR